ncbi:MAG TPA: ABC transporter permease [Candidatus Limnocylindrales bacterium]|nr:ABC transporter permease [Candidatus Limnocylindrales bacterium]
MITIAVLTLKEALRRRIVAVLLLLTIASVALTGWGLERLVTLARENGAEELQVQLGVSQVLILVAFMFSFVLAMTAAFLGAPAIGGEIESGVAQSMLARPIRRADLVVGRWLGLAVVVGGYAGASGLLEILVVRVLTGYAPPEPFLAVGFLAWEAIVILSLAVALSTRLPSMASGAVSVVLYGLAWMAGIFAGIGRLFDVGVIVEVARASRWIFPTDALWRGVVYALEPPLVIFGAGSAGPAAEANPFYASTPPAIEFVVWTILWVAIALGLAVLSMERREI